MDQGLTSTPPCRGCATPSSKSRTFAGYLLAVRPFCRNDDYWQVYFDVNAISQAIAREPMRLRAS
jgi:hypothetical protein